MIRCGSTPCSVSSTRITAVFAAGFRWNPAINGRAEPTPKAREHAPSLDRHCSDLLVVKSISWDAFGIVSDLISTHARKNIFGYRMMVWAIVVIGALSFVVWAHHMYVSGMNPYFGFFFAATTLIIAIPTAIKVYNWVLTLWRGDIHLTIPLLF